ncbi:Polyamine oxidase [Actinidia chinensis var. chinensis]|uniref:Polyamine oxidase n=1 Tax=Actinidia chinensis var. chinensis TaxID=1590841 RepID=A0A2R6QUU7_ACTCC|nr:Polyamine oxidase [Actinidia chinensis var. chinensis]
MVARKPRIVIIGAGMAGLTAANKLHTAPGSADAFELCVVEGGNRIGGRIKTSEFGGDLIEMGATWIHGIGNSPIHKIAQETHSLESDQPWECMDGFLEDPVTISEGGYELNSSIVKSITSFFNKLMDFAQGKVVEEGLSKEEIECCNLAAKKASSVGSFLRQGLEAYWGCVKGQEELKGYDNWTRKSLEEAVFAIHENTQRTYTSACDLLTLDYEAESEYRMFPGEEITIAKGYMSIIESIASVLPPGSIQLGRKVTRIQWQPNGPLDFENGHDFRPVKLHFSDGSVIFADHVIVTVSLGVLKAGTQQGSGMFDPPLPTFKTEAISRLGYGVVNKLFLELSPTHDLGGGNLNKFPFLQMAFHRTDSEFRHPKIPWWMRKTSSVCPIYGKSSVLLSWFAGKEALELESLGDEEIISGVSTTISSFLSNSNSINGYGNSVEIPNGRQLKFHKVLKSRWGSDPLFLGSYSYVAVGSSGDDLDILAMPLPKNSTNNGYNNSSPQLQVLFAGEATHRTHYSTTHGAYFSGLREANRLLQHYHLSL